MDAGFGALVLVYLFAGFWWVVLSFLAMGMRVVEGQYESGRFLSRAMVVASVVSSGAMVALAGVGFNVLGWVLLLGPVVVSCAAAGLFVGRRRERRGFPVEVVGDREDGGS